MSNQSDALIAAVNSRDVAAVTRLISQSNVDKNCKDKENQTALCMAARNTQLEIVNLLLKAGADVNMRGLYNITPLCWAIYGESLPIVKALLQAGADVNADNNSFMYTALFLAAQKGLLEIAQVLLSWGADPNTVGESGKKPLEVAKTEAIKQLIRSTNNKSDQKLFAEIREVHAHAAGARARREWMQRRDALQAQYDAAEKAFNFAVCGKVFQTITAEEKASITLVPTVDEYRSLAERHKKAVAAVEKKCVELLALKDFDAVDIWSAKLTPLASLDIAVMTFPSDAKGSAKVVAPPSAVSAAVAKQSSDLLSQYQEIMPQAAGAEARKEWVRRREDLEAKYGAAEKGFLFAECAKLWQEITAHEKRSGSLVPSVEEYKTLAERHKKLTKAVDAHCKVLLSAKDFGTLEALSVALTKLGELDAAKLVFPADAKVCALPSTEPRKGYVSPVSALQTRCQAVLDQHKIITTHTAGVPAREDWIKRRAAVQGQYDAAEKAKQFSECTKLGRDAVTLDAESAKLPLTMEDYKSLDDRRARMVADHQQLTAEVMAARKELLPVKDFAGLDALGQVLTKLQALGVKVSGVTVPAKPSTTSTTTTSATISAPPTTAISSTDVKLAYTGDPVCKVADPVNTNTSDPKHAEVTGAQCACVIM